MSKLKSIFLFICIFIGGAFAFSISAKVPTPQIYNVVPSSENSYRPWVVGWTPNEVEVEVLVDEISVGMAKVVPSESGTASFGWSPQEDLPTGFHQFRVRGLNNGQYSEPGGVLGFTVKPPVPAPILVEPEQFEDHILIRGLIKNNMSVKIFIDDILYADFVVPNHTSGTTNFWFKSKGLLNGLHEVYAVAYYQDEGRTRQSKNSSVLSFKTEQQKLTKGDNENETVVEDTDKDKDVVISEEMGGSIKITEVDDNTGVKVVSDQENTENIIVQEEKTKELEVTGEISSIEEINSENIEEEQAFDDDTITDSEKERKNRKIGLIILGVMVVILIIWYIVERRKASEEKEEDDDQKDNDKQEEKEEKNDQDQQELDLDVDKDKK